MIEGIELHIPTEQFGFILVKMKEAEPKEVWKTYYEYANAFIPKPLNSLPDEDFDKFIENMIEGSANHIETWEKMSPAQEEFAQVVKRAKKRIAARVRKA